MFEGHACDQLSAVQTSVGTRPKSYVAEENQEWLRLRALPAIIKAANEHFVFSHHPRIDRSLYESFVQDLGVDASRRHASFMLAEDQATTHSWRSKRYYDKLPSATGHTSSIDRLKLSRGTRGWVDFDPDQDLLPTAKKVQDCIQSPIEMSWAVPRRQTRLELSQLEGPVTWQQLIDTFCEKYRATVTPDFCERCFNHALKAVHIVCTPAGETITIEKDGKDHTVHGTGGGWAPAAYKG